MLCSIPRAITSTCYSKTEQIVVVRWNKSNGPFKIGGFFCTPCICTKWFCQFGLKVTSEIWAHFSSALHIGKPFKAINRIVNFVATAHMRFFVSCLAYVLAFQSTKDGKQSKMIHLFGLAVLISKNEPGFDTLHQRPFGMDEIRSLKRI